MYVYYYRTYDKAVSGDGVRYSLSQFVFFFTGF